MSEKSELEDAIAALEAQRAVLGDAVVDAAVGPMREKLAALAQAEAPAVAADDGERKFVTMIFADLSGSTALGEVMDPEEIRDLLNGCFDRLVPRVKQFGGTIDKFIGDNVMALFGAPVAHENDPERALRAALGMMEALGEFNADMGVELGIHVGINSGLVIAGGVGSEGERRYSVLGDAVNVAARLESASERGEILVGPDTRRLAGPAFEYVDLEPIAVKGRDEPVAVSRLVGVKAGHHSGRGIEGLSSRMVGRDADLERFISRLEGVAVGDGGVVAVVGDAGVGKSRFVAEARAVVPQGVEWVEGAALAHTVEVPYALAKDLVRDLVGVAPDAGLDDLSGALAGQLALKMDADAAAVEWPFLARLLDLRLGDDAAAVIAGYSDSPEILQQRTEDAFVRLVEASAVGAPLVLVWEDLHWADRSSLRLLERLLEVTDRSPLVLVLLFRPGDGPASGLHGRLGHSEASEMIELFPLSREDSESLVEELLRVDGLPPAAKELILSKAEGNPLFLEELLRTLIDAGMVIIGPDRAVATDAIHALDAIDIPDTVHGVIGARIDRLPAARKATLQSASVIGRVFQRRVLQHMVSDAVDEDLSELQRLDFVTAGNDETTRLSDYLFKHVFTQEAAYNGLLLARRRTLHGAVAEAVETLFPDRLEELSATLARHHQAAGNKTKATEYLLTAAQRAADAYANDDALRFANRGIELADAEQRFRLILVRDDIHLRTGQQSLRRVNIDELQQLAEELDDDTRRLVVLVREQNLHLSLGDWDLGIEVGQRVVENAGTAREHAEARMKAVHNIALALVRLSKLDESETYMRQALDLARDLGDEPAELKALVNLGLVYFGRKDLTEARRVREKALPIAIRLGDKSGEATIHQNLAIVGLPLGDYDYSRDHLSEAVRISREIGDRTGEVAGLSGLGEALYLAGHNSEALTTAQEGLDLAEEIEASWWVAFQKRSVGDTLIALNRPEEAVPLMAESVDMFRDMGVPTHLMDSIGGLARAQTAAGDHQAALETTEEAIQYLLNDNDITGAAYPYRIHWTCLLTLQQANDPRYQPLLELTDQQLHTTYPDGGHLPWHQEIRQLLTDNHPRP